MHKQDCSNKMFYVNRKLKIALSLIVGSLAIIVVTVTTITATVVSKPHRLANNYNTSLSHEFTENCKYESIII